MNNSYVFIFKIGPIEISKLNIDRIITKYENMPNVLTIHPTIKPFNSDDENVIVFIDLSCQHFVCTIFNIQYKQYKHTKPDI